ncbi:unnamed protein product [Chrysodeixis includens]|uniref:Uncharacterized protein n=1 Tax=Chrysodeixis includens TaxID=689277 RepID=A0A9P0BQA0_CHRIL|nr:unnamed protein product [Chrysodeixis includens]
MDRERRDTNAENKLWANPCDYKDSQSKPVIAPDQAKEIAKKLVVQANRTYEKTVMYSMSFAKKLHSYDSFDTLLSDWKSQDFLRSYSWLRVEGFPREMNLGQTMPDKYMEDLIPKIDEVLPGMYKGLKMIVAGLDTFTNKVLNGSVTSDEPLRENLRQTMHDVRAVLCYFNDIMNVRNLEIEKLSDSEIPTDLDSNMGILLYRDTLVFLKYLAQVFQKLYNLES